MPKYYDEWRDTEHICRKCGWRGRGGALQQGEMFDALFELDCPACGERVTVVELPTLAESRRNWHKVSSADRAIVELAEARQREQQRVWPKGKFRAISALVIGMAAFIGVSLLLGLIGDSIGLPPMFLFDTPRGYTVDGEYAESYSQVTSVGLASAVFSAVVAVWAARALYYLSWGAALSPLGRLTFLAWLMGATILVFAGAVVDLATRSVRSEYVGYLQVVLQLVIASGVAWACYQWWKNRAPYRARS